MDEEHTWIMNALDVRPGFGASLQWKQVICLPLYIKKTSSLDVCNEWPSMNLEST